MEIASIFSPVYDAEQYGIRLVALPRHADAALVTVPVTKNMVGPFRRTLDATVSPSVVAALGDCAKNCGVFVGAYGVVDSSFFKLAGPTRLAGHYDNPGLSPGEQELQPFVRRERPVRTAPLSRGPSQEHRMNRGVVS